MIFTAEDTATLKQLGQAARSAMGTKSYDKLHEALEAFILKLKKKYPERFKDGADL